MPLAASYTDDVTWPDVDFTLYLNRPLTVHERTMLDRLLLGWFDVGVFGGYSKLSQAPTAGRGVLHNFADTPVIVDDSGALSVRWTVDFGSAPEWALHILISAITGWAQAESEVPRASATPLADRLLIGSYEGFAAKGELLGRPWFD